MKRKMYKFRAALIIILTNLLISSSVFAQSPEKMSYQAVVRDNNSTLITSTQVGIEISILQGSADGTAVYVETQTPTTNANGLITIEIGGQNAIVITGNFSTIDWSADTYFIKTETDPTGGTNYTITGISQLLSVPYALHAKTAESITGTITETDPVFGSSVAGGIIGADTTNWNNKLDSYTETDPIFTAWDKDYADLTNKQVNATTSTDGFMSSADKTKLDGLENANITAGTGISVTGTYPDITITNTASGSATHYVGELIGTGGIDGVVFYVDETGEHGLICSRVDIDGGSGVAWSNIVDTEIGATAKSEFNGVTNTTAITGQSGHTSSAAKLCVDYSTTGTSAGDWYLPSIDELSQIYYAKYQINKALNVNSFVLTYYWSSTEYNSSSAWGCYFYDGSSGYNGKSGTYRVRAVRAF